MFVLLTNSHLLAHSMICMFAQRHEKTGHNVVCQNVNYFQACDSLFICISQLVMILLLIRLLLKPLIFIY